MLTGTTRGRRTAAEGGAGAAVVEAEAGIGGVKGNQRYLLYNLLHGL